MKEFEVAVDSYNMASMYGNIYHGKSIFPKDLTRQMSGHRPRYIPRKDTSSVITLYTHNKSPWSKEEIIDLKYDYPFFVEYEEYVYSMKKIECKKGDDAKIKECKEKIKKLQAKIEDIENMVTGEVAHLDNFRKEFLEDVKQKIA